jgi:hypothetical protein
MRPSRSSILLWIIHHLLRLPRLLLLLLVGVMSLWRCAIWIEGLRVGPLAKAIRRCIHGVLEGCDRLCGDYVGMVS